MPNVSKAILAVCLTAACGPSSPPSSAGTQPRARENDSAGSSGSCGTQGRPLRVKLFSYIPPYAPDGEGHEELGRRLEEEFACRYGKPVEISFGWSSIDEDHLGEGKYDLIEPDLSGLVGSSDLIGPWSDIPEVAPAAQEAATGEGGALLAWPTYLCGHFAYGLDDELRNADSIDELIEHASDGGIVGNFNGGSTTPSYYADAYMDTHNTLPTSAQLDPSVINNFRTFVGACGSLDEHNPCMDDTYSFYGLADGQSPAAATKLADGSASVLVGYSEYLYYVLAHWGDTSRLSEVAAISVPLGPESHHFLFVDGLVRSALCTGNCLTMATEFAQFLTSVEIQTMIAYGEDEDADAPRYLLMAELSFWNTARVRNDPVYSQLRGYALSPEAHPYREGPIQQNDVRVAIGLPPED